MIDRHISWISWVSAIVGGIVFLAGMFFLFRIIQIRSDKNNHDMQEAEQQQKLINAIEPLNLTAKGILIYDATTNTVLYEKNAKDVLPIASVTKLATAVTALSYASPDTLLTLPYSVITPLDPSVSLPAGKTFKLKDVVRFMLATSSNDAASVLADFTITTVKKQNDLQTYFPVLATQTIAAKGITPWFVGTPSGLDSETDPTVYASALSVARAMVYFVQTYPEIAAEIEPTNNYFVLASDGTKYSFKHTLQYDGSIPKEMVFAKTGYTDEAEGSLAFIVRDTKSNHMIAVVLLGLSKKMRLPEANKIISSLNTLSL